MNDALRLSHIGVVGGGPAGWLTALALVEWRPELEVDVVGPATLPTPATAASGASSTIATGPEGVAFLHGFLAIPPALFDRALRPAWSLGARRGDGVRTFAAGDAAEALRYDGHLGRYSLAAQLMEADRLPIARVGGKTISLLRETPFGYEVDRARLVDFLRERAIRNGVQWIDARVTEVVCDGGQVTMLGCDDGRSHRYDLYVDATGGAEALADALNLIPVRGAHGPVADDLPFVVEQIGALLERLATGGTGRREARTTTVGTAPDVSGEPRLTAAEWETLVTMRATVVRHALPPDEAIALAHEDPAIFAGLLHDEHSWFRELVVDLRRRAPSRGRASDALEQWASEHGVPMVGPRELAKIPDAFPVSPASDFGRFLRKTPQLVLRPRDQRELSEALRMLARRRIPFKVRAAGHSSGGQTLIDDGAIVDLGGLNRLVADQPGEELVRVEAGMWWLELVTHLRDAGRRPRVLTGNLRSSVGGTLAVGGFGEASHREGLQIDSVRGMTVMTLDGERHAVAPGDELFDWTLAGRGQLGVVSEVLLETTRQTYDLRVRMLEWRDLAGFFVGARKILDEGRFDFLKSRLHWGKSAVVIAAAGHFGDEAAATRAREFGGLDASVSVAAPLDFFAASVAASAEPIGACPAIEMVVPFDADGFAALEEIHRRAAELGLPRFLPRGAALSPLPRGRYPLTPIPATADGGIVLAIRPQMPEADVPRWLPDLHALTERGIAAGARLYLMSVEPEDRSFLERQLGPATFTRWRELKTKWDPLGLLNPGLIQAHNRPR